VTKFLVRLRAHAQDLRFSERGCVPRLHPPQPPLKGLLAVVAQHTSLSPATARNPRCSAFCRTPMVVGAAGCCCAGTQHLIGAKSRGPRHRSSLRETHFALVAMAGRFRVRGPRRMSSTSAQNGSSWAWRAPRSASASGSQFGEEERPPGSAAIARDRQAQSASESDVIRIAP